MPNWLSQNKDELTALVAVSGLLLSIYSILRNRSIERTRIKIKPVPLNIILTNFAGGEDDTKMYFQFEVINRSIFTVTIKEAKVCIRGDWHNCDLLEPYEQKLPVRVEARHHVKFILRLGNGDLKKENYESIKVCLSDDQEFLLNKRKIMRIIK